MTLTNKLLLTILMILFAISGFQYIGKSINQSMLRTAEQIREGNSYVR